MFVEVLYILSVSSLFISLFQIQDLELKRNPFYLGKRENIDIAACFENVEMTTQNGDLLFSFSFVKNYDRELIFESLILNFRK